MHLFFLMPAPPTFIVLRGPWLLHADDNSWMIQSVYCKTAQCLTYSAQVTYLFRQICQYL